MEDNNEFMVELIDEQLASQKEITDYLFVDFKIFKFLCIFKTK